MIDPPDIPASLPLYLALTLGAGLIGFIAGYAGSGLYLVFHSDEAVTLAGTQNAPLWIGLIAGVGLAILAAGTLAAS